MIGVMKIWERSKNQTYADYVNRWLARYLPKGTRELTANRKLIEKPGFGG